MFASASSLCVPIASRTTPGFLSYIRFPGPFFSFSPLLFFCCFCRCSQRPLAAGRTGFSQRPLSLFRLAHHVCKLWHLIKLTASQARMPTHAVNKAERLTAAKACGFRLRIATLLYLTGATAGVGAPTESRVVLHRFDGSSLVVAVEVFASGMMAHVRVSEVLPAHRASQGRRTAPRELGSNVPANAFLTYVGQRMRTGSCDRSGGKLIALSILHTNGASMSRSRTGLQRCPGVCIRRLAADRPRPETRKGKILHWMGSSRMRLWRWLRIRIRRRGTFRFVERVWRRLPLPW